MTIQQIVDEFDDSPSSSSCTHEFSRIMKFNGGSPVEICGNCARIMGPA